MPKKHIKKSYLYVRTTNGAMFQRFTAKQVAGYSLEVLPSWLMNKNQLVSNLWTLAQIKTDLIH